MAANAIDKVADSDKKLPWHSMWSNRENSLRSLSMQRNKSRAEKIEANEEWLLKVCRCRALANKCAQ